jgi:hypothetical protein
MFGLNSKRFSGHKMRSHKSTFRPQIEALETREVLSTSSSALHAVSPSPSAPFEQNDFYIDLNTHLLNLNSVVLNGKPNTPSAVQSLSAGHGPDGGADVFVTAGDGSFWKWWDGRWSKLLGPGQVKSFAAVDGGSVYAIFADNTLHECIGSSWLRVLNSGTVQALDAVTDKFGHDAIYVLNTDNTFGVIYTVPVVSVPGAKSGIVNPPRTVYTQLAAAHFAYTGYGSITLPGVITFSAGTDLSGKADVYAESWTGFLEKNVGNTPNGWSGVAMRGTFQLFSATDNGAVWVIGTDNTPYGVVSSALYEYDAYGNQTNDHGYAPSLSISAASSTDVYYVDSSHGVDEFMYDPNQGVWIDNADFGYAQQ